MLLRSHRGNEESTGNSEDDSKKKSKRIKGLEAALEWKEEKNIAKDAEENCTKNCNFTQTAHTCC
jgi:hypothetical protein